MAGTIYNSLETQKQRDWYRKIVDFGNDKRVPLNEINAALLLGNLESRGFRPDAESGTGGSGLFQYMKGTWYDLTNGESQFKMYKAARNQLAAWKFNLEKPSLDREKPEDQIVVMYAELAGYTKEFNSATKPRGKRNSDYKNAWTAYDQACRILGKKCPTDPYERYVLFIQAAHHGPNTISIDPKTGEKKHSIMEVITGWKKKIQPHIKDNLEFLKSKRGEWKLKVSQDDTEAETDKVAEAAERDSERAAPAGQPDDAYSTEDRKRKDLAGSKAEAETARRGGDSERGIPKSWIADAGNVLSDASNDARRSTFQVANEPMDVEKAPDAMKLREAPAGFLAEPGAPLRHALDALGVASNDIHLTPAVDYGNIKPDSFDMVDRGTSETIGSCIATPTGCEITVGDRKVVMDKINDSDVNLETYAKNDDGDYELQGTTRIGDNDGITVRRPWTGMA